jgi:hypothetical protein
MNVHRAVHGRRLQSSALLSEMIYGRFTEGRTLTDYAGNAFLAILTNGKVTEDKVEAHGDLLTEFPYLGPPHNA